MGDTLAMNTFNCVIIISAEVSICSTNWTIFVCVTNVWSLFKRIVQ